MTKVKDWIRRILILIPRIIVHLFRAFIEKYMIVYLNHNLWRSRIKNQQRKIWERKWVVAKLKKCKMTPLWTNAKTCSKKLRVLLIFSLTLRALTNNSKLQESSTFKKGLRECSRRHWKQILLVSNFLMMSLYLEPHPMSSFRQVRSLEAQHKKSIWKMSWLSNNHGPKSNSVRVDHSFQGTHLILCLLMLLQWASYPSSRIQNRRWPRSK